MTRAGVGFSDAEDARRAGSEALAGAAKAGGLTRPNVALVFASFHYDGQYQTLVDTVCQAAGCQEVVGCSTVGVIAADGEREREPGVVVLLIESDTIAFHGCLAEGDAAVLTPAQLGNSVAEVIGEFAAEGDGGKRMLVMFSDPLTLHPPRILSRLVETCPMPVLGGAASRDPHVINTYQWGRRPATGAVGVGTAGVSALVVSGDFECLTATMQSCEPIGDPFIVTEVAGEDDVGNVVRRIAGEPAADVLKEVIDGAPAEVRARLLNGLFIGIALDESKLELRAGDYLVRNVTGIDPRSGSLGVGDLVREGQTVQFQLRDAGAARSDMRRRLAELRERSEGAEVSFALYMNCIGRGRALFSQRDHDVSEIIRAFGPLPLAGLFTNSEFAPTGGRNLMHNYSGVLALFRDSPPQ